MENAEPISFVAVIRKEIRFKLVTLETSVYKIVFAVISDAEVARSSAPIGGRPDECHFPSINGTACPNSQNSNNLGVG